MQRTTKLTPAQFAEDRAWVKFSHQVVRMGAVVRFFTDGMAGYNVAVINPKTGDARYFHIA